MTSGSGSPKRTDSIISQRRFMHVTHITKYISLRRTGQLRQLPAQTSMRRHAGTSADRQSETPTDGNAIRSHTPRHDDGDDDDGCGVDDDAAADGDDADDDDDGDDDDADTKSAPTLIR